MARPLCRNVSGIFVVGIWEDFAGDFPRIFLGTFSHKNKERKSGDRIREKKPGSLEIKIREKSVLPKTDPNLNLYGPMALKVRQESPSRLALVHGWLFLMAGFMACNAILLEPEPLKKASVLSWCNPSSPGDLHVPCRNFRAFRARRLPGSFPLSKS